MIRRDYILRMIQEITQILARITSLKKEQRFSEAGECLESKVHEMFGVSTSQILTLSQTELLALVIRNESVSAVREKALILSTFMKEAGDIAAAQDQEQQSHSCYVKGLQLLLDTLGQGEVMDFPEFVPSVEVLASAVRNGPVHIELHAGLMLHYERTAEFGKAEDELFQMLELEPQNIPLVDFGIAFYRRLQNIADEPLLVGNLPRSEVEASLTELNKRLKQLVPATSSVSSS